ncbi:MAG: divergent polysaccharide deacetylase family protein [Bacillota bacterium]
MFKFNRLVIVLLMLSLLLVVTSCGSDEQETVEEQEEKRTEINYQEQVNKLDEQLKEVLTAIKLEERNPSKDKEAAKIKKTTDYQFEWSHSTYQLQIPLYGAKGELLSDYRREIIKKFKNNFDVVDFTWQDKDQSKLVMELGFKAQDEFKLMTHQIVFTQPHPKAKMAIIIDDFGFNRRGTAEILSINRPLTAAVLPFRPYSEKDAELAKEAGLEILLHQPLEPMKSQSDPGAGAIDTKMSEAELEETFLKNLNSLPQISGVNHHMGSKASTHTGVMSKLMEIIKERDLFYIDSSTSHDSVGVKMARRYNIATKENHLFIDNADQKAEVEKMILRLAKIALEKEELLIIGHVKENTAHAIKDSIPKLEQMGIKLVYASQIAK